MRLVVTTKIRVGSPCLQVLRFCLAALSSKTVWQSMRASASSKTLWKMLCYPRTSRLIPRLPQRFLCSEAAGTAGLNGLMMLVEPLMRCTESNVLYARDRRVYRDHIHYKNGRPEPSPRCARLSRACETLLSVHLPVLWANRKLGRCSSAWRSGIKAPLIAKDAGLP